MARSKDYTFRFKQFSVRHGNSSMRIGVDAVLLGSWAGEGLSPKMALDLGTGCGVIALMMAQRFENVEIDAIDIDAASIEEAAGNFAESPWSDRLHARLQSFDEIVDCGIRHRYDLIVSNPPYFDSGIKEMNTARICARHQGSLAPSVIALKSAELMTPEGRVAMVFPAEMENEVRRLAEEDGGLTLTRRLLVRGNVGSAPKRVLLEFRISDAASEIQATEDRELAIEIKPNEYTQDYMAQTSAFYLKF